MQTTKKILRLIVLPVVLVLALLVASAFPGSIMATGASDTIDYEDFITVSENANEILEADLNQLKQEINLVARGNEERRNEEIVNALNELGMDVPANTAIAAHAIKNFNEAISISVEEQYYEVDEDGNATIMTEDEIAALYVEQNTSLISAQVQSISDQSFDGREATKTTGNMRQNVGIFASGNRVIDGINQPLYHVMLANTWLNGAPTFKFTDATSIYCDTVFTPTSIASDHVATLVYDRRIQYSNGTVANPKDLEIILSAARFPGGIGAEVPLWQLINTSLPGGVINHLNIRVYIAGAFIPDAPNSGEHRF